MKQVDVIGPGGQLERRRAQQRTEPGTTYTGQKTRFPVGGLEPIPRKDEAVLETPAGAAARWRMYRFGAIRRKAR